MTITYSEDPGTRIAAFTIDGKVTREDFDTVATPLQAFIDTHGRIGILEVLRSFGGFEIGLLWPGIKFDAKNMRHISHAAVVTDSGWMTPIVRAASAVTPIQMRVFPLAEEDAARNWLSAALALEADANAG